MSLFASLRSAIKRPTPAPAELPFGGFWTDLPDADQAARRLHSAGKVSDTELASLSQWIRDGYVVLEGALDAQAVATLQSAIDGAIDQGSRLMTYWDAQGKHQTQARRDKLDAAECKVIDVHAHLQEVQQAIFAPKIARFLELVMDAKAIAFQTLYFDHGSEQPVHQDTAFVYVNPPLEFMASWIALQDIQPGSGELAYFPGSHRLPHRLFGNPPSKALLPGDPLAANYSAELAQRCQEMGLSSQQFRPCRGDALIWAADLAHGGAPRTQANLSRRSLVTHYCPAHRKPPYASLTDRPAELINGHFVLSQT